MYSHFSFSKINILLIFKELLINVGRGSGEGCKYATDWGSASCRTLANIIILTQTTLLHRLWSDD